MNPLNDTFLSTSKDLTVRVWSLKDSTLKFIFTQCITAAFDNTGQVLAIAHQKRLKYFINMYSAHSLSEVGSIYIYIYNIRLHLVYLQSKGTQAKCRI